MGGKKLGVILGILVIFAFSLMLVSAANEQCLIVQRAQCSGSGNYTVLGLSAQTNAHAELYNQNHYSYVLCCNFGNGIQSDECNGGAGIVKLSSATNAHAETYTQSTYSNPVCYKGTGGFTFSCSPRTGSCLAGTYSILSLSAAIDAHVGLPGQYPVQICCNVNGGAAGPVCGNGAIETGETCDDSNTASGDGCSSSCQIESGWTCSGTPSVCQPITTPTAYWSNFQSGNQINDVEIQLGTTPLYMIIKNSGLSDGTHSFYVYEKDTLFENGLNWPDDLIKTVSGTVSGGNASVLIIPTQTDWDNANDGGNDDTYQTYYFDVGGLESNELNASSAQLEIIQCSTIGLCSNYLSQSLCNADTCGVGPASAPSDISCSDPSISCGCWWNATSSTCSFSATTDTTDPFCGDSKVQRPNIAGQNEQCDPDAGTSVFLADENTCVNLTDNLGMDSFIGGTLGCTGACTFDITECVTTPGVNPVCGDNVRNQISEDCDGGDLQGNTCESLGFSSGILGCNSGCRFDTSSCIAPLPSEGKSYCGDGNINHPNSANRNEYCDGTNLTVTSCSALASDVYQSGSLSCSSACTYDVSQCVLKPGVLPACGDNVLNQLSEECDDGFVYQGNTCESLGFTGGTLGCSSSCEINTTLCNAPVQGNTGTCQVTQSGGDDCSDGFLSFSWIGTWIGQHISPDEETCLAGGSDTIPCPALVQLPFFSLGNVAAVIVLAIIIYLIISIRKGGKRRKKK
jgi:cysteine-rich repeat protein